MVKWIKNYLFSKPVVFDLNREQKDALHRIIFNGDGYIEKKEEINRKLSLLQQFPGWNPLMDIRFDTEFKNEDIIFMSDSIIDQVEHDPFFKIYCSNILRALILYVSKIPNQNALTLEYIYSIVIHTKNIPDLFIRIGFSSPSERETLEKWYQTPWVGMSKLALCLKPYIVKKFSDNENIVSFF